MLLFRGRGRNIRLLMMAGVIILTLCLLEYDSIITTSGNTPQYISVHSSYQLSGDKGLNASNCSAKTNFVYVKMFKCASTTLASMFRRFGYTRNLSVVLPVDKRIYLGWPYALQDDFYRPKKSKQFNILVDHLVYDREKLDKIMPNDTVYITSLREPFSQFKSMFHYYNIKNITHMQSSNAISEYLRNIDKWENIYKSQSHSKYRYCVPDGFSMSKNLMSFNLGFPTGFFPELPDQSRNTTFIRKWLQMLDEEFSLVLIAELLDESLVLLRRLMCWSLRDITFYSLNVGAYDFKDNQQSELVQLYREWSNVDNVLYNHFQERLSWKLANQTEEFWQEVQFFKKIISEVSRFCNSFPTEPPPTGKSKTSKPKPRPRKAGHPKIILEIEESPWGDGFQVTEEFCVLMQDELLDTFKEVYDQKSPKIAQPSPSKKFC